MTRTHRARFGGIAAAALCVAAVVWVAVSTLSQPAVARQQGGLPAAAALTELALLLPPAALAVAGASASQIESAALRVAGENASLIAALRQHAADTELLSEPLAAAEETLQRGGATTERLATRDSLRTQFDNAVAGHRSARDELRTALVSALGDAVGSENAVYAQRWSANALRKAPDHFKALDLDAEGWRLLESAWRRSERGEELSGPQAAALAAAQSSAVAIAAQQRLTALLPAVTEWVSGVISQPNQPVED